MDVGFRAEARQELVEAVAWYGARSRRSAQAFADAVDDAVRALVDSPARWPERDGVRRVVLRRFPYQIVYCVLPGRLEVLSVSHTSRRPDHWRDR